MIVQMEFGLFSTTGSFALARLIYCPDQLLERSGSVVSACIDIEGLWVRASQASLHCVLEQDINPCLVLVQPRKRCPNITEKLLTGM